MNPDTIFTKIIKREIPAEIVYEDEAFIVFLDIHPTAPGHCQVVPKDPVRWVWDYEDIGSYFEIVKKIAFALRRAYGTEFIRSKIFGEEVPHAHVWVWANISFDGTEHDLALHGERIRQALAEIS